MPGRLKISSGLALLFAIIMLSGCVTIYNPATERNETLLIDTRQEIELGKNMDSDIRKKLKLSKDPQKQNRVDRIGARVAGASDRQDVDYNFNIVDDKELNAFAIPGGYIYVNSGLMDTANDDELACVLAHEVGHVAARHSAKRLQAVMGYQLVMGIILGLTERQELSQATDIVFGVVNNGFSRQDEFLADKLAVKYAKRAGFNPYAMVTFFQKLQQEAQKRGPNFNLVFLNSHPPIEQRIARVKSEIAANP